MVKKPFIPARGDYIALLFDPQAGHEQKGWRPALVLSNKIFNQNTGLAIVCPVTNTSRDYPVHIKIPAGEDVKGVIMVDQIKSIDYLARKAKLLGKAQPEMLEEALAILEACISEAN